MHKYSIEMIKKERHENVMNERKRRVVLTGGNDDIAIIQTVGLLASETVDSRGTCECHVFNAADSTKH